MKMKKKTLLDSTTLAEMREIKKLQTKKDKRGMVNFKKQSIVCYCFIESVKTFTPVEW